VAGALGLLLAWWVARRLTRGLGAIQDTIDAVRRGQTERRVHFKGTDEAALLGAEFNRMLDTLAQRENELREHRLGLESLVAERTRDLKHAKESAESANRAKSEFLASVSHELRTPLNAVLGLAQVCRGDPLLTEQGRAHATRIEAAGQHLLALVNDLIDLSRVETGRVDLSLEAVPVMGLVEDSLSLVGEMARARGVQLLDTAHLPGVVAVRADRRRLRQVMSNLLSNAIKYNRQGGTVQVSCGRGDAGQVRMSVIDTGQGIAAKLQPRLFSAFDRLGAERGLIEGTGIGLVITHRLVQAMGGQMGFESTPGQGSVFWLDLPQAELAPDAALPAPLAGPAKPASADALAMQLLARATAAARPKRLVLYVEDNPVNTLVMQEILAQRADVRQRHATTGEEGLAMAIEEPPALVLMDINLPGMDGYAALAALRANPSTAQVPVLAVSANAMMGDEARALDAGFAGYVVKPVDVASLHAQIDRLLNAQVAPAEEAQEAV